MNGPVNMVRLGPSPSGVSYRRPALFPLSLVGRGSLLVLLCARLRAFLLIRLELPSMQRLEFGFKFRVLSFQKTDPLIPDFEVAIKEIDDLQMLLIHIMGPSVFVEDPCGG